MLGDVGALAALSLLLLLLLVHALIHSTREHSLGETLHTERVHVHRLAEGVERYCASPHVAHDGISLRHRFPTPRGPEPSRPGPFKQSGPHGPEWDELGFEILDPTYYVYSIVAVDDTTLAVRSEGDLDGDGARSRFESTCTLTASGCACSDVVSTHERE